MELVIELRPPESVQSMNPSPLSPSLAPSYFLGLTWKSPSCSSAPESSWILLGH